MDKNPYRHDRRADSLSPLEGSGTPRPKTISARDSSARTFRPIFQSGTARPTCVGPLGLFYFFIFYFLGGGRGKLSFYSVYVHQNKVQEILFNMIIIFRQENREIVRAIS